MAINVTLNDCLREINRMTKRLVSFEQILQETYDYNEERLVVDKVLTKLNLSPEYKEDITPEELQNHSGSPILLRLKNGNWVCFASFHFARNKTHAVVFDPISTVQNKIINVPAEVFLNQLSGTAVLMHSFPNAGFSPDKHYTAYFCFSVITKHLGNHISFERILHEFPTEPPEPSYAQCRKVAEHYGFSIKKTVVPLKEIGNLGKALPAIIEKNDGSYAIFAGIVDAEAPEKAQELRYMIWDPQHPKENHDFMQEYTESDFCRDFTTTLVFVKKNYSMTDTEQPFSLLWFVPEFLRQKKYFIQVIFAVIVLSIIALIIPLFFQIVVDKVLVNESYNTLNVLGVGVVCALLFSAVMEFFRDYLVIFATNKIDIRTASRAFQHLLKLPISFFEQMPAGVLIKHMQQLDKIRSFLSGSLFFSVLELLMLFVFVPFMWIYSSRLTVIVLLYSLLIASIIFILIKPFQRRLRALYVAEGKRQSMLVETINGIRTVKSMAIEPTRSSKWNDVMAFSIDRYFDVNKISLSAKSISRFLEQLMAVNIIWLGALDVFNHTITIGALIAFQMLSGRVSGPIVKLIGLLHEYQQTALSVRMLGQVMNHPKEMSGGGLRPDLRGEISFDKVSFKYALDAPPAINNISLRIPPSGMVGIVGRSGSGKTTLTKLLQGLYPIQSGIIKCSGIDLREIEQEHLRSGIGVVLQESFFFSGTIKENLLMSRPNASMEELLFAVRLAGIEEFIQQQSKGFDTLLEENATNLSGGQKQRLAIARALLPNPQILIFDEATSALDPESEEIVRKNLREISYGRTVLVVSHRLSMVAEADMIVVLDSGEIVEQGKHRELLEKHGIYRDFWDRQGGHHA